MSSEIQPLLQPQRDQTKTISLWYQNTKFLVFAVICLTLIISGIFWYSAGHVHHGQQYDLESDLTSLTTLETVDVTYMLKQWTWSKNCEDDETIELTFAVKQTNVDRLEEILLDISDPKSENYGKRYTWSEINELVKPQDDSISTITSWLISQGINANDIKSITPNSDFIRISTTIQQANALLNTEYGIWINSNGDQHRRVKDNYFIPKYVAQHLDFISPTLRFPVKRHITEKKYVASKESISSSSSVQYVTPAKLKSMYNVPSDVSVSSTSGNSQCVGSFLEEYYDDDDLTSFWEYFNIESSTMIREPAGQPDGYGSEAELDVEYITSIPAGVTTYVWYIEDDGYFISLVEEITSMTSYPYVVSMSYGGDEQSNGYEYCARGNVEFAKGSALGITFFASSGDEGAAGESGCGDDNEYLPSFPATSQYVTAVGGTYGGTAPSISDDISTYNTQEEAWYNSGGGFSVFFDRQSYQNTSVENYFNQDISFPNAKRYNLNGRAYPDISAQSVAYLICYESSYWSVSGTSCSCPSVAGMFTLINDLRLQSGKTTLGWLNPALYELYSDQTTYFNDVTSGYNEGCDNDNSLGFYAATGWDPITGLGTPKLSQLINHFVNL